MITILEYENGTFSNDSTKIFIEWQRGVILTIELNFILSFRPIELFKNTLVLR